MPDPPAADGLRHLSTGALFWIFLRLGTTGFGGLGASLALMEAELIEKRRLLQPGDLLDALAAVKLLPGSTLAQVVSFVGFRLRGWGGSAIAITAFLLPSVLAMLLLAALREMTWFAPILARVSHGLSAAVVGLLMATVIRFARTSLKNPLAWTGALAAFGVSASFQINASLIVIGVGALSGLLTRPKPESEGNRKGGRP